MNYIDYIWYSVNPIFIEIVEYVSLAITFYESIIPSENVRRSLNISTASDMVGGSGPPSPASLSPPSLEDQVNNIVVPLDGEDYTVKSPHSLHPSSSKHLSNKSSRKQISPQHIDLLTTADREVRSFKTITKKPQGFDWCTVAEV